MIHFNNFFQEYQLESCVKFAQLLSINGIKPSVLGKINAGMEVPSISWSVPQIHYVVSIPLICMVYIDTHHTCIIQCSLSSWRP